ncbi:MAG: (2Fe-2S) ferredoxin domain-containing protein [Rhodospirillaceae bacterium]|nr:(2Fe-2S) ferredoxin domain-containing protein [Rhodospirillaceae bacterium]
MIDADWIPVPKPLFTVRICINKRLNTDKLPSCGGRGSRGVADLLERLIMEERLPASVTRGPCMNNCLHGPTIKIQGADFISLEGDVGAAQIEKIMAAVRAEAERRKAMPPVSTDAPPP